MKQHPYCRRRTGAALLRHIRRLHKRIIAQHEAFIATINSPDAEAFKERCAEWNINLRLMDARDKREAVNE